jgi:hypothetical protein
MQMLYRAGVRCAGRWPAFEDHDIIMQLADGPYSAMALDGTTVKLIASDAFPMPSPGPLYRAVWIDRNPYEQARSQIKFMKFAAGIDVAPTRRDEKMAIERLMRGNAEAREKAVADLQRLTLHHVSFAKFEDLVMRPAIGTIPLIGMYRASVEQQQEARHRMALAVRRRPTTCQKDVKMEQALVSAGPPPAVLEMAQ